MDVHEYIERRRDVGSGDAIFTQTKKEVLETAWVVALMLIQDLKHLLATWRQQEVVQADRVGHDGEHPFAIVGVQDVVRRQVDSARIVQRTT